MATRCDSFVVETDVHFPTDIHLLFDAIRKVIECTAKLAAQHDIIGWRQSAYQVRQFKQQYRGIQKLKRSKGKTEHLRALRELEIKLAHQEHVGSARAWLDKAQSACTVALDKGVSALAVVGIEHYASYARLFCDQILRRVVAEQKIPHEEKVFSIFEPHTEWISKGKAGVPQELGLRVCIVEDQHRFILHHKVMVKEGDDAIAVEMVQETQARFPEVNVMSFDKGFHSPKNQKELAERLDEVVMPKKGKRNADEERREKSDSFQQHRRQHSAVESAINGLEHHGLDKCCDHGLAGFERYVGLSVLSRNIKRVGTVIRDAKRERRRRSEAQQKRAA